MTFSWVLAFSLHLKSAPQCVLSSEAKLNDEISFIFERSETEREILTSEAMCYFERSDEILTRVVPKSLNIK